MSRYIDLTAQTFGRLFIISDTGRDKCGRVLWKCKCSCENIVVVLGDNLRRGLTQSCGCLHKEKFRDLRLIKIDRRRKFGKLKVISGPIKRGPKTFYLCKCNCGNQKEIESYTLRQGLTLSCGCLRKERVTTHGLSQTREYKRVKSAERRFWLLSSDDNYTVEDIIEKLKEQNYLCYYCGDSLESNYHVDHMIPLSRGGSNGRDNICISCPTCNLRKNRKTAEEFINSGSNDLESD